MFERLAPATVGLVKSVGTFELKSAPKRELRLCLETEACSLGPFPIPVTRRSIEERVLLMDAVMCVTQPEGSREYAVWVRPSMKGSDDDDDDVL